MNTVSPMSITLTQPVARRALVVAYCFPPNGAIGSFRTLRLVKRLVGEGWETSVLTGDAQTYPDGTRVDPSGFAVAPDPRPSRGGPTRPASAGNRPR